MAGKGRDVVALAAEILDHRAMACRKGRERLIAALERFQRRQRFRKTRDQIGGGIEIVIADIEARIASMQFLVVGFAKCSAARAPVTRCPGSDVARAIARASSVAMAP